MAGQPQPSAGLALVVMGVSGSGKTTIAEGLAGRLGWPFVDGDDLHPPANVAKMHAGIPLTDADRQPWLEAIAALMRGWLEAGRSGVVACSALRRAYRGVLAGGGSGVWFVYLKGSHELIGDRLQARRGHFMPPTLLASQLATLEEPGPDEQAVTVTVEAAPDAIVDAALARLGLAATAPTRPSR